MSERQEREFQIADVEFPDDVLEVYLVPENPPIYNRKRLEIKQYLRIYPIPWWKRCYYFRWLFKHHWGCCCCCGCGNQPAPAPPPPAPPAVAPPPTIVLSQGMNPGGNKLFFLLITPQGSRAQFTVRWNATGGVGQLTVDLEVREPGSATFRVVAPDRGPNDQITYTGPRGSYLFRATVTDSRGQSGFNTLSVDTP